MLFEHPRIIKKGDEYATHVGYAINGDDVLSLVVIDKKLTIVDAVEFQEWETAHVVVIPKF